jgi:hypothetical protein
MDLHALGKPLECNQIQAELPAEWTGELGHAQGQLQAPICQSDYLILTDRAFIVYVTAYRSIC